MARKRITITPKGQSAVYADCPTCPKLRSDERPTIVPKGEKACRYCEGIEWQKKHPVKNFKKKVRGRAKMIEGDLT